MGDNFLLALAETYRWGGKEAQTKPLETDQA